MICQRFILVIICSALSMVTDNSLAIASEKSQPNFISDLTATPSHRQGVRKVSYNRQPVGNFNPNLIGQNVRSGEPVLEDAPPTAQPTAGIDRRFALVTMAITSTVALLLLWLLFRPQTKQVSIGDRDNSNQTQEIETETVLEPVSLDSTDSASPEMAELEPDSDSASIEWLAQQYRAKIENESADPLATDPSTTDIDPVVELIEDLRHSDRQIRRKAIWELAEKGDPRCIQPLVNIVPAVNSLDKSLISNALTQIVHRSFQPINHRLFANLEHQDPQIRKNAIHDLSDIYLFIAPITKQLVRMQLDEDLEVSQAAVRALHQLSLGSYFKSERHNAPNNAPTADKAVLHLVSDPVAELDAEP